MPSLSDQTALTLCEASIDLFLEIESDGTITAAKGDAGLVRTVDTRSLILSNLFQLLNGIDLHKIQSELASLEMCGRVSFEDPTYAPKGRLITFTRQDKNEAGFCVAFTALHNHHCLKDTKADDHLIRAFRMAITSDDLQAARQPVVCTQTGKIQHYEMLARFPFEGSPYPMIVAAEERGIISELDCIMLENACAKLSIDEDPDLKLAINISGQSIQRPDIASELLRIVRAYSFDCSRLIFEITESSQIHDVETASRIVDLMRSLGVKIVLDDFGAGAASFGYLRSLNVDGVKFDGCFLNGEASNERNTALMRAIAGMCQELGMSVVGERVETEEDRQTLLSSGVTMAQGYFFGRPEIDATFFAARSGNRQAA